VSKWTREQKDLTSMGSKEEENTHQHQVATVTIYHRHQSTEIIDAAVLMKN
jgi:hypothetical protein